MGRKIVFQASCKTAAPTSWRPVADENHVAQYDCVILTQTSSRRRYFEVYTYGVAFGNYPRLEEAKAAVEAVYGPLPWARVLVPRVEVEHYYFGPTTEFSDPTTIYVTGLPRLGAKSASGTTTVYRGIYLQLKEEDYAGDIPSAIVRRVQQGGTDHTYGTARENLGVHWTTDKRVAQHFATPMTRSGEQPTLGSDGWGIFVPVVLTAEVSSADVVTDEEELRNAMVEGFGWNGIPSTTRLPEQEVLVRPGAPIRVTDIEAVGPSQWWRVKQAFEEWDAGRVQNLKVEWRRIGGGLSAVATLGSRLWWRVHPEHREFLPETATSVPFFPGPGQETPQPGFSCTESPWHLWAYLREQFGYGFGPGQDVVGFTGTKVGTGHDGEPLVMPDMGVVARYSWEDFLAELVRTPFPPTPRGPFTWLSHYATWEAVAEQLEWMDTGDPVEEHIVATFGSRRAVASKTAGAAGDLPEGITFEVLDTSESASFKVLAKVSGARAWDSRWAHRMGEGHADLVGIMVVWKEGEVHVVEVSPSYRRMGIASEMFKVAKDHLRQYGVKYLDHSSDLSDEGRGWRDSLGAKTAGAAGDLPEGITFKVDFRMDWDGERLESGVGLVYALDGDTYVGSLFWDYHSEPPVVTTVQVETEYRRRGVATRLWQIAKENESQLVHSDSLTADGQAWSQVTASAPGVYYHLAPVSARGSIERHGLDWQRGKSRWEDAPVGFRDFPKGNYVWRTQEQAEAYRLPGQEFDVWEVSVEGLTLGEDPMRTPGAMMVTDPIPPSHLRLVQGIRATAARRYFHASPHRLEPGTILTPSGSPANFGGEAESRWVYLAPTVDEARHWGRLMSLDYYKNAPSEVFVYEVEPRGRVKSEWVSTSTQPRQMTVMQEFQAKEAEVIRLVETYTLTPEQRRWASRLRTAQPGVYYHVTSYENWSDIRANGLRPGHDGHVWLFTETDAAMRFKDAWDSSGWSKGVPPTEWTTPPCIVVVRTDRAVPTEAGIPGAYWVKGIVTKDEVFDVIRPGDLHHYASRRTAALEFGTMKPHEGPLQRVDNRGPNIRAEMDGNYAGHIYWDAETGEVTDIFVVPTYRRQGIATALWQEAKRRDPNVRHSSEQTGDGKAWAEHTAARKITSSFNEAEVIRRGLAWDVGDTPRGLELAKKAEAGTLTAEEIVRALEPLGIWWGLSEQYGDLPEYEAHAEANLGSPVTQMLAEMREEAAEGLRGGTEAGNWFGGQIAVVFTAKRPKFLWGPDNVPTPWDPDLMNPLQMGGLMGNSYLPRDTKLEIIEVRYDPGDGIYRVLPTGIRTTAAKEPR